MKLKDILREEKIIVRYLTLVGNNDHLPEKNRNVFGMEFKLFPKITWRSFEDAYEAFKTNPTLGLVNCVNCNNFVLGISIDSKRSYAFTKRHIELVIGTEDTEDGEEYFYLLCKAVENLVDDAIKNKTITLDDVLIDNSVISKEDIELNYIPFKLHFSFSDFSDKKPPYKLIGIINARDIK